jgi:hypothetical protein
LPSHQQAWRNDRKPTTWREMNHPGNKPFVIAEELPEGLSPRQPRPPSIK